MILLYLRSSNKLAAIDLGKKDGAVMLDTESDAAIVPCDAIMHDVDVMWFYPKVAMEVV